MAKILGKVGSYFSQMGRETQEAVSQGLLKFGNKAPNTISGVAGGAAQGFGGVFSGALGVLEKFSGPKALMGVGAVAGLAGLGSVTGGAVMDTAMTAAFGDSNVDRYFMGSDMSGRFMAGSLIGGPMGTAMQFSAPGDFFRANPIDPGINVAAGVTAGAGVAGGAIGAMAGSGIKGRVGGGVAGAVIGSGIGAGMSMAPAYQYASNNREFMRTSPYSASRNNAMMLNADGNIVLGMHNSRRSY